MTSITHTSRAPVHPLPEGTLVRDFMNFISTLRHRVARSQTRDSLRALSDAQLVDIGLSRREIDDIASRVGIR